MGLRFADDFKNHDRDPWANKLTGSRPWCVIGLPVVFWVHGEIRHPNGDTQMFVQTSGATEDGQMVTYALTYSMN